MDPESVEVLFQVVGILDRIGVPYHLGGSYASAVHGIPRQTHDIDIVIDLRTDKVTGLVAAFAGEFYIDEGQVMDAVTARRSCNLVHLRTGLKIDLFVKGDSEFDRSEFERKRHASIEGAAARMVYVKSAEDTILRKLLWYRRGGEVSQRQWEDVRGIVRHQGDRLDRAYLIEWADRVSIRDLLDRLFAQS